MIVLQVLLTLIIHSLGRVLNMALGWATVMLFGRVPQERQIFLSVVAFGSIVWLTAVVGIAFPSVSTFLLAFVSLPRWVDEGWVRIAMVTAALIVPPLVGESALRAVDPDRQSKGAVRIVVVLFSGYRLTLGIAVALVAVILLAPLLWSRNFLRRWMTRHVPVVVHRNDYPEVLDDIQGALVAGGVHVKRGRVEGLLRVPTAVLALAAGGRIRALDAETARLFSTRVEILLYPFDLVISGEPGQVSHAQAIAAEQLPRTKAHMTWSEQGNALEDRLKHLWRRLRGDSRATRRDEVGEAEEAMAEVEGIRRDLKSTFVSYEEWEVLLREMLMVERDLLRRLIEREESRRSRHVREAIRGG